MALLVIIFVYEMVLSIALGRAGHRASTTSPRTTPGPPVLRVLIIGATGGTGRCLVAQALERGLAVTVLARRTSRLAIDDPRLTVVCGDVRDADTVDTAVRGQDAVLCALGHKRFLGPTSILPAGTRILLRATSAHGVQRLVRKTSLGIGASAGRLGLLYTFFTIPVVLPFYF